MEEPSKGIKPKINPEEIEKCISILNQLVADGAQSI